MNHKEEIALLIKRNAWERAEQLCQSEILNHPTDPETWFYMGAVQSVQGRRIEAIRSLKAAASYVDDAVSLVPKSQPRRYATSVEGENMQSELQEGLLLRIARALLRLRAYDAALPVYQRLDFSLPQVVLGTGRCYWGVGRYQEALQHFAGLWQARPQWAELGLTYARALCSVDETEKAQDILSVLYKLYPHEPGVLHQYALLLLSQQGVKASAEWLLSQQTDVHHSKLALLRQSLAQQAGLQYEEQMFIPADERELSQWESYQLLAELNENTRWFGDNTALLKHVSEQLITPGIIIECGVFHGRSLNLLARWTGRQCHGFDSFEGLPEAWSQQEPAGAYSTNGMQPQQLPDNVELHQGWFDISLPEFVSRLDAPISLLHIDCDLYSSTQTVLKHFLPHLSAGSMIVFDDFAGYPEWRQHEYKAWQESVHLSPYQMKLSAAVMLGRSVAFQLEKNT